MTRALALSTVLLVTAAASCGGTPPPAPEPLDSMGATGSTGPTGPAEAERSDEVHWRSGTSKDGTFTAYWRPLPDPIPKNDHFELEVRLYHDVDATRPWPGARLIVDAAMPQHGHGMFNRPETTDLGDGLYRIRGMLFHMAGTWQLYVDVRGEDGRRDRLQFAIEL